MNHSPRGYFVRAFSLIELIVVIAIIAMIAAFTVPAASTILRGSKLTQAAQMVTGQISLARQQAMTRNKAIEVRLMQFADPDTPGEKTGGNFQALQVFEVLESGVAIPLDKAQMFPGGVIMHPAATYSTLIAGTGQSSTPPDNAAPELPRVKKAYKYVSFRFQQDGSTNLKATDLWFVTLCNSNDVEKSPTALPANYFTLQIDPVSGSTKSYRPSAG